MLLNLLFGVVGVEGGATACQQEQQKEQHRQLNTNDVFSKMTSRLVVSPNLRLYLGLFLLGDFSQIQRFLMLSSLLSLDK